MLSRLLLMIAAGLFAVGTAQITNAQEASPAPGSGQSGACAEIEPRDAEFFRNVAATPESGANEGLPEQENPGGSPTPFAMPEGNVVDEQTSAAVTALYQQLVACLNEGDFLRAYALYTDDYLVRNLSEEAIAGLEATPVPTDESMRSEFGGLLDARSLEDGRIAALVTISNPQSGEVVIYSILRDEDGRLRIDDETVVESAVAATPPA